MQARRHSDLPGPSGPRGTGRFQRAHSPRGVEIRLCPGPAGRRGRPAAARARGGLSRSAPRLPAPVKAPCTSASPAVGTCHPRPWDARDSGPRDGGLSEDTSRAAEVRRGVGGGRSRAGHRARPAHHPATGNAALCSSPRPASFFRVVSSPCPNASAPNLI